jgi:hypothetical protein
VLVKIPRLENLKLLIQKLHRVGRQEAVELNTWYKITPSWFGSSEPGSSVRVLFTESNMVFYLDSDNEVRILSSWSFKNIYTQDQALIDPYLPYDYAILFTPFKAKFADIKISVSINRIGKWYYKTKKFLRGT